MQQVIYLDNSATTQVFPQAAEKMKKILLQTYGNPSSLHKMGYEAEKELKEARHILGNILKVNPATIHFCSGGTEANNWAIKQAARRHKKKGRHLITTSVEHVSALSSFKELEEEGFHVTYLTVDERGSISLDELRSALKQDTILVSIMHVNNETGTIFPIEEIGKILKDANVIFHVDGVQSFGKLGVYPEKWGVDLLSFSAHKIHGPKGTGALHINKKVQIPPLLVGGGQEGGKRAGTENVPGIAALGEAARIVADLEIKHTKYAKDTQTLYLKKILLEYLSRIPGVHFNGASEKHNTPIINLWFEGVDKAEVLLHMFEEYGLYVSTGSACHSRHQEPSHVLQALGARDEALYGAIRLSIGYLNKEHEMKQAAEIIEKSVKEYRQLWC
ncbi:MAG: cysteine desulfurase [Clostridia bacterium]|nr:cysteine desulfurase [Clostridia bacterium]